jgi:glycosyltransferase involved in cell wall biosynthesis
LSVARKKVVLFISDIGAGGAERVFANLAGALSEKGLDIILLVNTLDQAAYLGTIPASVQLCELGVRHTRSALPGLIRFFRRERPAVIITAHSPPYLAALVAAKLTRTGTRVIATLHQTYSQADDLMRPFWSRTVVRTMFKAVRWADAIVAVSHAAADDFARLAKIPRDRITVIYNPIVGPAMLQAANEPLDHPWFQPGQPPVILGVGRLTVQKDFPNLLRAFALVHKELDARLMLLGEGNERSALEGLVRSLSIADCVALPGVVENPFAYMKRAALFVLSSAWEALPTVLVEAMACGCPVVSTDCLSGPREILQGGRLGRLVPIRNETALAESMLKTLTDTAPHCVSDADLLPFTHATVVDAYLQLISKHTAIQPDRKPQ